MQKVRSGSRDAVRDFHADFGNSLKNISAQEVVCAGEYLGACGKLTMAGLAGLHEVLSRRPAMGEFRCGR